MEEMSTRPSLPSVLHAVATIVAILGVGIHVRTDHGEPLVDDVAELAEAVAPIVEAQPGARRHRLASLPGSYPPAHGGGRFSRRSVQRQLGPPNDWDRHQATHHTGRGAVALRGETGYLLT